MASDLQDGQPMVEYTPERISLTDSQVAELRELMRTAATNGARQALHELDLNDPHAARDIREMRDLLSAWRSTKQEMWRTIVKVFTTAVLGVIAAAVWMYSGRS